MIPIIATISSTMELKPLLFDCLSVVEAGPVGMLQLEMLYATGHEKIKMEGNATVDLRYHSANWPIQGKTLI